MTQKILFLFALLATSSLSCDAESSIIEVDSPTMKVSPPRYLDTMALVIKTDGQLPLWTSIPRGEDAPDGWREVRSFRDLPKEATFHNLKNRNDWNRAEEIVLIRETNLLTGEVVENQQLGRSGEYGTTMKASDGGIRVGIWRVDSNSTPKLEKAVAVDAGSIRVAIESSDGSELQTGDFMRIGLVVNPGEWVLHGWSESEDGMFYEDYGYWKFTDHQVFERRTQNLNGRDCFAIYKLDPKTEKLQLHALNKIKVKPKPTVASNYKDNLKLTLNDHYILKGEAFSEEAYVEVRLDHKVIYSIRGQERWEVWKDVALLPLNKGESGKITVTSKDISQVNPEIIWSQIITK